MKETQDDAGTVGWDLMEAIQSMECHVMELAEEKIWGPRDAAGDHSECK